MNVPLQERISRYIGCLDPAVAGQHGHDTAFRAACVLVHGFGLSEEQAWPFALEYNARCAPPWSQHELKHKLRSALTHPGHTRPRGYLLQDADDELAVMSAPLPKLEPTWHEPDSEAIDAIVRSGLGIYDLWEQSPTRHEEAESHAEEIIDVLFPGNPLLCCAKSNEEFATRRREVWRGKLSQLPLIVPNPMLSVKGPTQGGWLSEHSKAATARRVYLCIEFDFSEKARDGVTDTIVAPLVRSWHKDGIEIIDACAALILHLRERLSTLASACHSGGKSLHAWFRVLERNQAEQKNFMRYAVSRGADRATWVKSQLVRIPDGRRNTGERQVSYYFDPREAVINK